MKKLVAFLFVIALVSGIMVGAFAVRNPNTCSHSWGVVSIKDGEDAQDNKYIWVPSCPGHPWAHYHHQTFYFDTVYYECKYGCGATKTERRITYTGPVVCQYHDS